MKSDEKRLREIVRRALKEDFGDYGTGGSNYGGVTPWTGGYGGSSKGSHGTGAYNSGMSLGSMFIAPFVNAVKVVGAELGQVGVELTSLVRTTLEATLSVLVPKFQADYGKIEKSRQKYIAKIREKYKPAYEAVQKAWENPDFQLFSFMHDPVSWLSYRAITAKPDQVMTLMETIAEGNNVLALYLRDIRNRLGGPAMTPVAPGQAVQALQGAHAARTEAAPAQPKKKTRGELIADALTSPEFKKMVAQSPLVAQMKKDAASISQSTNAAMTQAMQPVLNAHTAEDLAHASGGAWQVPPDYEKLEPDAKSEADEALVGGTKNAMKAFYKAQIEKQVEEAEGLGVDANSAYVRSLQSTLASLK